MKVVTAAALSAINLSFQTQFNKARGAVPGFYRKLCMECPSSASENVYGWLADLPQISKKTAEAIRKRLRQLGYTLRNEEFSGIIEVPRSVIEDDQYGIFGPVAAMWGQRAAQVPDLELIALLKTAFTTGKDYTGSAFISANKKAHNQAAVFSNNATKKLSADNFVTGYASLRNRTDAEGVPLFTLGDSANVFLVVCPEDESVADSIVKLPTLANGGANPNYNKAQVMVMPGLNNGAARPWFILDCSQPVKPLIYQPRVAFELTPNMNLTSDRVFNEDVFSWKARGRLALGFGLPEYAYGSTGADAA